jgi:hypothetical protein
MEARGGRLEGRAEGDERISGQISEGRCIGTRGSRRVGFLKAWRLWCSAASRGQKESGLEMNWEWILGDEGLVKCDMV